jgi:hypothetical protein
VTRSRFCHQEGQTGRKQRTETIADADEVGDPPLRLKGESETWNESYLSIAASAALGMRPALHVQRLISLDDAPRDPGCWLQPHQSYELKKIFFTTHSLTVSFEPSSW